MFINKSDIVNGQLYEGFINQKKPLLIKNFFQPEKLKQSLEDLKTNIKPLYSRGAVPFLYCYFNNDDIREIIFNLPIIKELKLSKQLKFRDEMRLWNHDAGNLSCFHYDQRSTDLLNICLSGSKKWLFLPPENSLKCWPFYNVALPFQNKQKTKSICLTMEKGDLVYIPRNWFHQVKTLKNNTQNINVIFNDCNDCKMQSREKELAAIKKAIIPHYIYGDNIAVLNIEISSVKTSIMLNRLLKELFPVVIVVTLLWSLFHFII